MSKLVEQSMEEKIKQRRSQMLIHSYLYYTLDSSIITDHQWQAYADELRDLQDAMLHMKGNTVIGFYDKEFVDWDGSTGYDLPTDSWVVDKALKLLRYKDKND